MELSADYSRQTICAVATAFGAAGIAVVRVSGADAIRVVDSLFRGKHPLCEVPTHTAHYGTIGSPALDGSGQNVLDEVVCTVFRAPHSFTGEDTVEISCHGSLFVQQELVRLLIDAGARMADKGEFTKRAFLNGRIDLAQAEAVADLIAASSAAEKDVALSQLRGGVSGKIAELREQLLTFTSLLELELDFADHEELEFADRSQLTDLLNSAAQTISSLIATFQAGNAIKQGVQVAIVGAPNAGKSTLLNALLGDERAIVSDIRGTTRDTIEDTIIIGGVLVRLTDTAGIQSTEDVIEQKGIEDLQSSNPQILKSSNLQIFKSSNLICISAKLGDIQPLLSRLESEVANLTAHTDSVLISNARHYEALCRAQTALERVSEGLQAALSGELLALDLHDALDALGEITGEVSSQEVLNTIFERFCIGK